MAAVLCEEVIGEGGFFRFVDGDGEGECEEGLTSSASVEKMGKPVWMSKDGVHSSLPPPKISRTLDSNVVRSRLRYIGYVSRCFLWIFVTQLVCDRPWFNRPFVSAHSTETNTPNLPATSHVRLLVE